MTIVEIICISLLSMFIVLMIAGFVLDYLASKRELERERKIDYILQYVEEEMEGNIIFPEFKD